MTEYNDDVSNIHRRYSLTLLHPSSFYHSLLFSIIVCSILVSITVFFYLDGNDFLFRLLTVLSALVVTQYIDSRLIKNKEYSKALHMSLFGNLLWLLTAIAGILSAIILSKPEISFLYVTQGMFLLASFRIGILTTVLGASLKKAWLLCFIQPLAMYMSLAPVDVWTQQLTDEVTLAIGLVFLTIASVWSVLTDKAGRPNVQSTHKLVQAYLNSMSQDNPSEIESIISKAAKESKVSTSQIRLFSKKGNSDFRFVLPDIHPGPFHPVGGSNIPYLIYKNMGSSAMVMHSVSDHSLNLPSKNEVDQYLHSLSSSSVFHQGISCTEPVTVQVNKGRVVGLAFGNTALLFLSLSPHGMEDIPNYIRKDIENYSKNRNYERVLIVDCHNAMGGEISQTDSEDLLTAAKSCLDTLITKESYALEFGYANSGSMNISSKDLADGGIGILCLKINNKKYFLGWADANNMENGVREKVVEHLSNAGYNLLEICTSDTHYTSMGVRNRNGYYHFGLITNVEQIADWYLQMAINAEKNIEQASFEILENKTDIKVMGPKIFKDYSKAVDNSLKITKAFLLGCLGFFLLTMFI